MKKNLKRTPAFVVGTMLLFMNSCSKSNVADTTSGSVPNVTVSLTINIKSSDYSTLSTVGGTAYLTNVGYRGILLYRLSTTTIMAFDRTCTYDLPDAGGIVYALTNNTAICADCNSIYNLYNGSVNTGPSTIGLKAYNTALNQSTGILTITN